MRRFGLRRAGRPARVRRYLGPLTLAAALLAPPGPAAGQPAPIFVDTGQDPSAWTALASPGATVSLGPNLAAGGGAGVLRADFDLGRGRAHVLVRRKVSLDLPADYMFVVRLRGDCEPNTVEFKLVSGENVWWRRFEDHEFSLQGQVLRISKSRVEFAWGPAGGGMPRHLDAIEIAVVAGHGGKGSVWLDELRLEPRNLDGRASLPPSVRASSAAPGTSAAAVLDGRTGTLWRSAAGDRHPTLVLDFHDSYEHGGLIIDQDRRDYARAYVVEASDDGRKWSEVRRFRRSNGGRDYVYLPDLYARYLRLCFDVASAKHGVAIDEVRVQPFEFSASLNGFFAGVAADAAPGLYPRYFAREQSYWTVVGAPGDVAEALLNEEGMLEVDSGAFSLEPFVWKGTELLGWKQATCTQSLEDDELPIPTVSRGYQGLSLAVTAFADGPAGGSTLYARYRLTNTAAAPLRATLLLAVRPLQVLPSWQKLNMVGGATRITDIAAAAKSRGPRCGPQRLAGSQPRRCDDGATLEVDARRVVALTRWSRMGASAFEQGDISSFLARGVLPPQTAVHDDFGHASAALAYDLELAPGAAREVWIAVPFHPTSQVAERGLPAVEAAAAAERRLERVRQQWHGTVARVGIELPAAQAGLLHTLRSNLAYVLVNRDGPAIQPGSRTYARSWIRDGALTSASLLELGFDEEVREFLRWYAGFQREDGWVPCCVDRRGADPVPEHDSFGEFLWAIAEVYRHGGDQAFVREMWPHAAAAARCMQRLRATNMTPEYRRPPRAVFFGLLPESISHEGYSARPVHSYWDDVFALRGFLDAATLAALAGDDRSRADMRAEAESFRATLHASIVATMRIHGLDTVPASAELGDFDPTSTAVAFVLGVEDVYPSAALARTFDRYVANVKARAAGPKRGVAYTGYEMRDVPALMALGRKQEAVDVLMQMVADARPPRWRQWPEISWLEPTAPSFLGDLPHSWVGSTFLHAVRTLLVYERGRDGSLVLGAGIPLAWLQAAPEQGKPQQVAVRGLSTHYGAVSYRMRASGDERVVIEVEAGIRIPSGAVVVAAPFGKRASGALVDGRHVRVREGEVRVRHLPARVEFEYRSPTPASRPWP